MVTLVKDQLPAIPAENIIAEPAQKDTAAAIALAALLARKRFGKPLLCVFPADHLIEPQDKFEEAIHVALQEATRTGCLVTLGIAPTSPATAYGWIEREYVDHQTNAQAASFEVQAFREKPNRATAALFLKAGNYLWNSGMLFGQVDSMVDAFQRFRPGHLSALSPAVDAWDTKGWNQKLAQAFDLLPRDSMDYAILEKLDHVLCVPASFRWIDLGGWLAMQNFMDHDDASNAVHGSMVSVDARNCLVFLEDSEVTLALVGVKDLIVAQSGNRLLVAHRDEAEAIREAVQKIHPDDTNV